MPKKNIRNFRGYGAKGKKITWPNNAKLALQIVLNYEEGGENCILNGDKYSETFYPNYWCQSNKRKAYKHESFMSMDLELVFGD